MTRLTVLQAVPVVAAGGAAGALARWLLSSAWPAGDGFPWAVFAINVLGSALLALLPALVSGSRWLPLFLGTGMLGGFTTMSAASEQTARLLQGGHQLTGLVHLAGTLLAAVVAVWLVDRLSSAEQRALFADEEGDE